MGRPTIKLASTEGGNPISRTDPFGLACNGLDCWNTPTELSLAANCGAYYQAARVDRDSYACAAGVVAAGKAMVFGLWPKRSSPTETCAAL